MSILPTLPANNLLFILPSWVRLPKNSSEMYIQFRREILLFSQIREFEQDKDWIPMRRCQLDTFILLAEAFPQSFRLLFKNAHEEDDMYDRNEEEEADDDVTITTEDSSYMEIMFYFRFTKPYIPKRMQDGMFINKSTLLRIKNLRDAYDYLDTDLEDEQPRKKSKPETKTSAEEIKEEKVQESNDLVKEVIGSQGILTQDYNLLPDSHFIYLSDSDCDKK
jgi:hypothetical protein